MTTGNDALSKLILPGTPALVRERYHTLAERATQTDFGLLEQDIVMLDTETTGLSFKDCELIEIAAARINGREVVNTFQTFVHPAKPVPAEIQALTGITNYDVANAPNAVEAVAALAKFVGGMPVVAHNATFDRTFIQKVPGGWDVTDTWIDSLTLSRIALPCLRSHALSNMAEAFGCSSVTHRAMADVEALCGMWRILLLALTDLPAGLMERLAGMHEDVDWSYRPIFSSLALGELGTRFSLRDTRHELLDNANAHRRMDSLEDEAAPDAPTQGEISDAFGKQGLVSHMYEAYEVRPEQVAMAQEVREALQDSTHRALEAGTGVGKSVAYLVPSVLFAQRNNVTVGVATKTNALTDQLVSHELPALAKAMGGNLEFCSIKGYDHYPCLRRLDLGMVRELPVGRVEHDGRSDDSIAEDMLNAMAIVASFACQSPDGDLDALGIRWRYVPRDMLSTAPSECMRTRCPYYPHECFVHGARRRAACSDLVVTNHALLLRDIALDGAILPPIRHWVVDEAHSFDQEARRQWAKELSAERAHLAFASLGDVSTGTIHSLMTRTTGLDSSTLVAGLLTKAAAAVRRAAIASGDLFGAIHELVEVCDTSGGYDSVTQWISDDFRLCDEWREVENCGAKASGLFEEAAKCLDEVQEALAPESAAMASEVGDATRSLKELNEAIRLIILEPDPTYVYSAELYRAKRRMVRERLEAQKLDVGADLASSWYPNTRSAIYTSATIAVGESFEHFDHAVGLDLLPKEDHKGVTLRSSFDFDTHMTSIVARDMPAPNDRRYMDALIDLLYDVHVAMDGSVLTLFTNRREMERAYAELRPRLLVAGLELACQERRSSPRRLREQFVAKKTLSLFALRSFWEGFDAAGDTLRCVVVPKLPFASPRDPLVREREIREQRSWWRYSLPEAVLTVKQAAGRLIRTANDTGVLVIADSRVSSKRYGQTFVRALPTHNCIELETKNIGRYIGMWRSSHE